MHDARTAPGPSGRFLVGHLPELMERPHEFFLEMAERYGDVVKLWYGSTPLLLLRRPEHALHVLATNAKAYSKQTRGWGSLAQVLGTGLVTAEGELWRKQRRIIQPLFAPERLTGFVAGMGQVAARFGDEWAARPADAGPLDMAEEMTRLTLRIVGATLLGAEFEAEIKAIGHAVNQGLTWARENTYRFVRWPSWIPTAHNRRFREAVEGIDRVVLRILDERRRAGPDGTDLLSILMCARDAETGEAMSDRQIRDEVATIFVAGHETTSNALTWTWTLLSRHPEAARRVAAEAAFLAGRPPGADDLPRLPYLKWVLEEALRLYPPAWVIPRRAEADDVIGGFRIEKGWYAFASPYVTHRHAALWPNPEGFDPERFTPEAVSARPRGAWFPFGIGSRHCIGGGFAMMEAQVALATLVPRFRPDLVPGARIEPRPQVTLRPAGRVPMSLHPRAPL